MSIVFRSQDTRIIIQGMTVSQIDFTPDGGAGTYDGDLTVTGDLTVDGYLSSEMEDAHIVYVDPAGDDDADGSITAPMATLREAFRKAADLGSTVTIQLSAGDHALNDKNADSLALYNMAWGPTAGAMRTTVKGTTSTAKIVTQTSTTNNVITVSDTLIVDELIGTFLSWEPFPGFVRGAWVLSNTVNTITMAHAVPAFGGFGPLPSGTLTFVQLDSRILPPPTSTGFATSQLYVTGEVGFFEVDFYGINGGTGGTAVAAANDAAKIHAMRCRFREWGTGVEGGEVEILGCRFENISASGFICSSGFTTGACVFKNVNECIDLEGKITLGAFQLPFIDSCSYYITGRLDAIEDFHLGYYLESGGTYAPTAYVNMELAGSKYSKLNNAIIKRGGAGDWASIITTVSGGNTFDLLGSASASIGATATYISLNGVNLGLADYNAGVLPATGVRLFSDDRGSFAFD